MEMDAEPPVEEEVLPPENETPEVLKEGANIVTLFLVQYGWYLLFGLIVLMFLKKKFEPKLQKLQKKREDQYYAQRYDAQTTQARHEAMMAARLRMQEEHDEKARIAEEERQKKEEEKRQAKIEDWERHKQGKGYKSKLYKSEDKASTPNSTSSNREQKPKPSLRQNDYNPLMGGGGGGFRPSRRSGFGGGG